MNFTIIVLYRAQALLLLVGQFRMPNVNCGDKSVEVRISIFMNKTHQSAPVEDLFRYARLHAQNCHQR